MSTHQAITHYLSVRVAVALRNLARTLNGVADELPTDVP